MLDNQIKEMKKMMEEIKSNLLTAIDNKQIREQNYSGMSNEKIRKKLEKVNSTDNLLKDSKSRLSDRYLTNTSNHSVGKAIS